MFSRSGSRSLAGKVAALFFLSENHITTPCLRLPKNSEKGVIVGLPAKDRKKLQIQPSSTWQKGQTQRFSWGF
jgi:hypothetical protein